MNKRLKFFLSVILIFAIFVSSFTLPALSFENKVETSTSDMLLINLDTETVVYSHKPDTPWYAGTLAELMTFLLVSEKLPEPEKVSFKVEKSFIDSLPYIDGCLDRYVGQTLTAYDLTVIMLLTNGNDAAYALANLASNGKVSDFVADMNARAAELGMTNTGYVSPGFNNTSDQYTTCRDLYKLYMEVLKHDAYNKIMQLDTYTPAGLSEGEFTVNVEVSILNENSPYYFRYTNDAQFSYTKDTYAGIAMTTTYHGMSYFYAGLLGLNESEHNVYADAKKLTTWAYLNLSDRKMIGSENSVTKITVHTDWGSYEVSVHPLNSAYKTLPNDYDESKLSYEYEIPETLMTPIPEGQSVGRAKLLYNGDEMDSIDLVGDTGEGLNMLEDAARFGNYVLDRLTPYQSNDSEEGTEPVSENSGETSAETTAEG